MARRITLKTLAESCGISTMAASYAMRGDPQVSIELQKRVQAKAAELGYIPSTAARRLRGGRSKTIGIVLPLPGNPVHMRNLEALERACRERGIRAEVHFHYWHEETEREILADLLERRLLGLVLYPAGEGTGTTLASLAKQGLSAPFAGFGVRREMAVGCPDFLGNVSPNAKVVGRLIIQYLASLGHKNIAFLFQGSLPAGRVLPEIARGFQEAASKVPEVRLQLFNLDDSSSPLRQRILKKELCRMDDVVETDRLLANYFLDYADGVSVVVTSDDLSALSILNTAVQRGIRVPEDLSIMSLGGTFLCQLGGIHLSHASVPVQEIARMLIDRFLDRAQGSDRSDYSYSMSVVPAESLKDLRPTRQQLRKGELPSRIFHLLEE